LDVVSRTRQHTIAVNMETEETQAIHKELAFSPFHLHPECTQYTHYFSHMRIVLLQRARLGPLRQAFLTRLYQFETDCLSGSINRSVVTPF
jgi:hypothetical protein